VLPIIKAGTPEALIIDVKAEGMNEMEGSSSSPAEACYVARVGGYLWVNQDDMEFIQWFAPELVWSLYLR